MEQGRSGEIAVKELARGSKLEIRSSKEFAKFKIQMFGSWRVRVGAFRLLGYLNLFRISDFEFRD
jgi:hypothetical protein